MFLENVSSQFVFQPPVIFRWHPPRNQHSIRKWMVGRRSFSFRARHFFRCDLFVSEKVTQLKKSLMCRFANFRFAKNCLQTRLSKVMHCVRILGESYPWSYLVRIWGGFTPEPEPLKFNLFIFFECTSLFKLEEWSVNFYFRLWHGVSWLWCALFIYFDRIDFQDIDKKSAMEFWGNCSIYFAFLPQLLLAQKFWRRDFSLHRCTC